MLISFNGAKLVHVADKSKFSFAFVGSSSVLSIAYRISHVSGLDLKGSSGNARLFVVLLISVRG
jgi:hypothetical protein